MADPNHWACAPRDNGWTVTVIKNANGRTGCYSQTDAIITLTASQPQ